MRRILRLLPKPSHFAGAEWGAVRKDPASVSVRVALAFPDMYEVGMSYLGQKILSEAVNRRPRLWAERVYAPSREAAQVLREHAEPLCTLESDTPLAELDAVAFHITHELCYTNVLYMLDLAGIPLRADQRGAEHPLILAGGGCAFNAEPLAPFVDAMVLGDGEEALPEVLEAIGRAREQGLDRLGLLHALRAVRGVYVPAFFEGSKPLVEGYGRVEKAVVADLDQAPFPLLPAVSCGQAVHDRMSLEIARGCTRGCRFCQAGMIYRPVRERSLPELGRIAGEGLAASGYEELSFLSLSTGDFSALESLFEQSAQRCLADQVAISLPSLRAGTLSPRMLGLMAKLRRTGATVAPEAGSERLRRVINKGITEEDILAHAERLFAAGWQSVKLYFMIGLPTETDEDLEALADLAVKVLGRAPRGAKRLQVTVAVSTFVPKAHTPFQWEAQIGREETERRLGLIKARIAPYKRISIKWHEPRMSWLEGVFSRGGRELAPAVERAYALGATFSSWVEHLDLDPWEQAFRECGIDAGAYLDARPLDAPLPWDHLGCGVTRRHLLGERERALAEKATPDCRYGDCVRCGACPSLCGDEQDASGVRPRLNRGEPEWKASMEQSREEPAGEPREDAPDASAGAQEGGGNAASPRPQAREELTRRAAHYRVWFSKTGPAAYLSQLELASVLERALRRSGLKPSFSAGFHPMPMITFGWALPVGVESREEWFALFLREPALPGAVSEKLGAALPEGLKILRTDPLGMGKKVAQPVAEEFRLAYHLPEAERATRVAQWRDFLAAGHFPWYSVTKRGARTMDIRPLVTGLTERQDAELSIVFSWRDNRYASPLKLVCAVNEGLSLKDFSLTKVRQIFEGPDAPLSRG
ncbi:tRNA-2-methylthio-N(6)-dimethylallyladenosine synthase [Fundidesulfovibrio magnetotacticus]|uniref:tRNA-2-methylthio-N(6)-dimethylallyladenosine synthase n=1 Tax=Fundidesulfovibrio magnetotacticus TaxID=2730080 RepID=A0A6V8LSN4_9BACT|nr:TIGR03960 family B12-binding radical SAM protein [Fundidesulfovibrio magnetotacticus]GFK92627.1 tRNA-2-methylthio-N(6)-dimethylallyladenosine synthase [Fundidesulfovibrio magnetotacticus]